MEGVDSSNSGIQWDGVFSKAKPWVNSSVPKRAFFCKDLTLCRGSRPRLREDFFSRAICANKARGHEVPLIKKREHLTIKQDGLTTQHFLFFCVGDSRHRFPLLWFVFCVTEAINALSSLRAKVRSACVQMIAIQEVVLLNDNTSCLNVPQKHDLIGLSLSLRTVTVPLESSPGRHYCLNNGFWTLQRQVTADSYKKI